jgi:hypothetical protein
VIDPLSVLLGAWWAKPELNQRFNGAGANYNIESQTSYRAGLV